MKSSPVYKIFIAMALIFFCSDLFSSVIKKTSPQEIKKDKAASNYTVKPGETLFGIAKKYKVKPSEIMKWNKLKSDNLKAGQKLIVGYAKKKSSGEIKKVQPKPTSPPIAKPAPVIPKSEPPPPKQVQPVKKKEELPATIQTEKKEITEKGTAVWIDDENINPGKYFALHHSAPVGTIVKVTNPANQKSVYVKVVGKIPYKEENQHIIIKLSKGASDKLEIKESRFETELSYSVSE